MNKPEVKNTDKVATVYIIDDDPDVLESLEWLIESHGYHVKVYESASLFLDHYKHEMSGCILLDIRMPEIDGLELQRLLSERGCNLPTIFVTGHAEVPIAIAAIRCGGYEFLEKPINNEVLMARIDEAMTLNEQSRQSPNEQQEIMNRIARLTAQEKRIMQRVTQGISNRQMAQELGLSPKTVEVYRTRVMQKMNASSLPMLVRLLVENGLA